MEIANTIESRREAMMYIIKGATNQGKTYTSAKFAVPYLMKKHGVDVVFYTYPQNEVFNKNEWRTKGYEIIAIGENDQKIALQIKSVIDDIENGVSGHQVCHCNDQQNPCLCEEWHRSESYGQYLAKKLHLLGKKMAFILDECHTWTVSHIDAYVDVRSTYKPPKYDASHYISLLLGCLNTRNFCLDLLPLLTLSKRLKERQLKKKQILTIQ